MSGARETNRAAKASVGSPAGWAPRKSRNALYCCGVSPYSLNNSVLLQFEGGRMFARDSKTPLAPANRNAALRWADFPEFVDRIDSYRDSTGMRHFLQ